MVRPSGAPEDADEARLLAEQAGEEKMKRVRALGISGHSLGVVPLAERAAINVESHCQSFAPTAASARRPYHFS